MPNVPCGLFSVPLTYDPLPALLGGFFVVGVVGFVLGLVVAVGCCLTGSSKASFPEAPTQALTILTKLELINPLL